MAEVEVFRNAVDTWVNGAKTGQRYDGTDAVWVVQGTRRGLVRVALPNLLGETVTEALLYGHAGPNGFAAQQFSLGPLVEHFNARTVWSNQPDVDVNGSVFRDSPAVAEGELVGPFDVRAHLQAVADGDVDFHGWRVGTDHATGGRFVSAESGQPAWELHLRLADDVDQPTNLRPDGGAVSSTKPPLAWEVPDFGEESQAQAAYRVQVDTPAAETDPDEVTPDYDSGWVTSPYPRHGGDGESEVVTNLSTTPGFETAEDWVAVSGSADPVRSTDRAAQGSWSLKCARGSGTNVSIGRRSAFGNLLPGAGTYTLSMDVWVDPAVTGQAGIRVSGTGTPTAYGLATGRGVWETVHATFTWDGSSNIFLDAYDANVTAGAVIYLDKMIPVAGSEPVPYFDGSTPDTGFVVHDWTGTVGASTSTRTTVSGYPARVGLGPHYWRVIIRDVDGNESEWSEWADFTVDPHPDLIVDSPTGSVGDPEVQVLAHLASGTVGSWFVWATGPDRSDVRWRSGTQTGAIDATVPFKNKDGRRVFTEAGGWLLIHVADDVDRATAEGEQPYREVWVPVTFEVDGSIPVPTDVTVTPLETGHPVRVWRWRATDVPNGGWGLQADGQTLIRIPADELTPDAGTYTYTDAGQVRPMRPQTLGVVAFNDGKKSAAGTVPHTHVVDGVWLLPDDPTIGPIDLWGTDIGGFAHSDRVASYEPLVGPPVDITYDYVGMSGEFSGWLHRGHDIDVWEQLDRIEALRTSRNRLARMVWGSQTMMVKVRNLTWTSDDSLLDTNLMHRVSFAFFQVGD